MTQGLWWLTTDTTLFVCLPGKTFQDRELQLNWYTEQLPGKEGEEEVANLSGDHEQEEQEDDGYTPPQEDYLPPGLQEHEESLSRERTVSENVSENAETEELNEHLLDEEEEEEDGENEERSWKRRNNGEEWSADKSCFLILYDHN